MLERVQQLSEILGLRTNSKKTQLYRWSQPRLGTCWKPNGVILERRSNQNN